MCLCLRVRIRVCFQAVQPHRLYERHVLKAEHLHRDTQTTDFQSACHTCEYYTYKEGRHKTTHCQSTNHKDKHLIPVDVMD